MLKTMTGVDVKLGLKTILQSLESASLRRSPDLQYIQPHLVCVSKTKPVEMIIECYEEGQRHFGENYVNELVEKAHNKDILEKCKDIQWHFIGHLQTNKINKVLGLPNLHLVETVHDEKLANNLNKSWPKFGAPDSKLRVMVQVNTSGEDEKNGIEPEAVVGLYKHILDNCANLELHGLMTIGKFGYDPKDGQNPDFLTLLKCKEEVCCSLGKDRKDVNLSMGMSTDFEQAIEMGSTYVRVGSSIFGFRPKKE